ncbi:MAG: hypothetical protein MUF42_14385 [Cytophagaceae bacterium]|jgi:hypothetical protein|nr:hypothetical protein [Cytophagaceae bacterium]
MSGFFKKALGLFVEIEESKDGSSERKQELNPTPSLKNTGANNTPIPTGSKLNEADIEKFEKHFDKLFEQANLPGPDYYEFCKMSETLEAHISDEKARMAATFASLSIQGLTKQKLLEAAEHYKQIVLKDKQAFEGAIDKKAEADLESRKSNVSALEKRIQDNAELIKKLTAEITDAQQKIATLKQEISVEEQRLIVNKSGYNIACEAMLTKISTDIQKIQTNL